MGFFSKRKDENNGFIINTDDEPIKISGDKNLAPHAMTPEEVSGLWAFGDNETPKQTNALDSLKKRMNVSNEKDEKIKETPIKKTVTPKPQKELKPKHIDVSDATIKDNKTLMEKVKRYTIDEQGHDVTENQKPLYELESVAEILMNDGETAMKNLSKKYGLDFVVDDLGKKPKEKTPTQEATTKDESTPQKNNSNATTPTPAFEQMVNDSEARENRKLYESLFEEKKAKELPDISVPDISDIDTQEVGITNENPISNTATIRFTPIKDNKGNTDHITISSVTKHIDLGEQIPEDISSHSSPQFEESDFDAFTPQEEYTDAKSGKQLLLSLAKKKRSYFIDAIISLVALIALSLFFIPSLHDFRLANAKDAMVTCSAFLFVSIAANIDMCADFKNLLNKRATFDIMAALFAIATLTLGVTASFTNSDAFHIIFLCAVVLFIRTVCKFKFISTKHSSLKKITNDNPKNAVALINDSATTFAMAKNSIDGDVLIAAHKKTGFVENFCKHYDYHSTMSGKTPIIFYVTLGLALICGIIAYFLDGNNNIFSAVFAATCITGIASIPTAFLIDTLPLTSAAKKLNNKGAMIAGIYGAEKIENANAAVINVNDIFPQGTITLHDMKVLSNNNIDEILLRAASLTAAVGSPLRPIFEEIAGTNTSYSIPDSDTVKYEKNLGISGWVDNEPLFIGNRSLMKAHGIDIPSLEVDKKILRQGYFPVYVATSTTACALIIVQYNVDYAVEKELHKITDLGVLLLVENCDPNVNEAMLCDYFGLYDDSVRVMTNTGLHMYKNAVPDPQSCSSPAIFRGSGLNFIKIVNCASGINKSNRLLTILYSIFAVLGALYFVYAAFSGVLSMPQASTVLLYALGTTVLSIIGFLIRKP